MVIDIDPPDGEASLAELEAKYGKLPDTAEQITGRGGKQLFFVYPPGVTIRNASGLNGWKNIDVRGEGGYVVLPPSLHPTGNRYEWVLSSDPLDPNKPVGPATLPDAWVTLLASRPEVKTEPSKEADDNKIVDGTRNEELFRIGCAMRRRGSDLETIAETLLNENRRRCVPPLPETEVRRIAQSCAGYAPESFLTREHRTDAGNARRLVHLHGGEIRYCAEWGTWLIWDGRRWQKDNTAEIMRLAKTVPRQLYALAVKQNDEQERKKWIEFALRTESRSRLEAIISLAQSEVPITADELDADPWVLNVENGTLHLPSGELRQHHPGDYITKLVPWPYVPDTPCPQWESFLHTVFNHDEEVVAFVQRAVGYSLCGDTSERCLFLCWGPTRTGKTTFLETIRRDLLADYGLRTPAETLMLKRQPTIPNDVPGLKGARFVTSVETAEGARFAESLVKDLTGGDTVTARFLHREYFEFVPECKLWIGTNHRPGVRGTDDAIWDRIRLIPFVVKIPNQMPRRIVKAMFRREMPGILCWAYTGFRKWQHDGLQPPTRVTDATEQYRQEENQIARFLDECCVRFERAVVLVTKLYEVYRDWAGREAMGQKVFAKHLEEAGLRRAPWGESRRIHWHGVGLLEPDKEPNHREAKA